jgi:hypothetical protein
MDMITIHFISHIPPLFFPDIRAIIILTLTSEYLPKSLASPP